MFLIWGVADNIVSTERMAEFVSFLRRFGFPVPEIMAPLSVWAQFVCGLGFVLGLFTRWAGLLCAVNFVVALVMVDGQGGVRAAFPSSVLVLLGQYFATNGTDVIPLTEFLHGGRVTVLLRAITPPHPLLPGV